MEFLKAFVSPVVFLVVNPIIKHVTYPFKVGKNVRKLEVETEELVALKTDVETTVENAQRENGAPTDQVQLWLRHADDLKEEADEILEKYRQPRRCLFNLCPNILTNYTISRRASKKLVDVKNQKDKRASITEITHPLQQSAQEMPASSAQSSYLDVALHFIREEEHAVIGIWGMGGVGKTHLLTQINNELCKDRGAFNDVMFLTCSKECSIEKVQNAIIKRLDLKLESDSDMDFKAGKINHFLKQRSFVLLLDDLWHWLDLKKVGIMIDGCKSKIVLTTRSEDVCRQMDAHKKVKVEVLNPEQSWSLFKEKVTEETINSDPLIQQEYARMVAKELKGLPLALITIGRAMHDRKDPKEWEHTIEQLKQARLDNIELLGKDESVFRLLKFSYDNLKNDILKECFLLCSLWPEDSEIYRDHLVDLWMGLGLIDETEIQRAYNVGYSYTKTLQAASLLETTKAADSENYVKMHDVIRDMALWIASNEGVQKNRWIVQPDTTKNSTEIKVPGETQILSSMYAGIQKVSFSTDCASPKLSTFLLLSNYGLFINGINTFRLDLFPHLTVLNMSYNNCLFFPDSDSNMLKELPIVVCKLLNLRLLNWSGNGIQAVPKELEALVNLKYLILRSNPIHIFPSGIVPKLKALRVLDLYTNNSVIPTAPALLEKLQCLGEFQALGITISVDILEFQKLKEVANVPIRWLLISIRHGESCLSFTSSLLGSYMLSSFLGSYMLRSNLLELQMVDMDVEWIEFESPYGNSCPFKRLETLRLEDMGSMKEIQWKGVDPKDVFPRLKILHVKRCHQLRSISWVVYLPCIRVIHVVESENIRQLVSNDDIDNSEFERSQLTTFPSLQELELSDLPALESICDPKLNFPALNYLYVIDCPELQKLPFRKDSIPASLKLIDGEEGWWDNIQWDDLSVESSLQSAFVGSDL